MNNKLFEDIKTSVLAYFFDLENRTSIKNIDLNKYINYRNEPNSFSKPLDLYETIKKIIIIFNNKLIKLINNITGLKLNISINKINISNLIADLLILNNEMINKLLIQIYYLEDIYYEEFFNLIFISILKENYFITLCNNYILNNENIEKQLKIQLLDNRKIKDNIIDTYNEVFNNSLSINKENNININILNKEIDKLRLHLGII